MSRAARRVVVAPRRGNRAFAGGKRAVRSGAAIAAAALALGGCGVKQMLYPAPGVAVGEPPPGYSEVVLESAAGDSIHGWQSDAAAPGRPALLFLHGNGENLETMRMGGLFGVLEALDVHTLAIDYPGYGRSGGAPSEAGLLAAAAVANAHLRSRHPASALVVCGWSLGAAVAVQTAAADPEIAGLVAMSAWGDLESIARLHFPGFLVGLLLSERYDSLAAAERVRVPALVIHGARDEIIPIDQGRRLAAALAGGRWVELAGAGHNDLLARPAVWDELRGFVDGLASD